MENQAIVREVSRCIDALEMATVIDRCIVNSNIALLWNVYFIYEYCVRIVDAFI